MSAERRLAHPRSVLLDEDVDWYEHDGTTVVDHVLPLCEEHHHLVHEGRWNLTMTSDPAVAWTRPDGSTWIIQPSINRLNPVPLCESARQEAGVRPTCRAGVRIERAR